MAHIKRIDLTRDVEAHAEAYRKAIENVCKETAFSGGKYADAFDKEFAAYVGSKFASGVNNGTSALHLAMLALGVGPGDEVIVPAVGDSPSGAARQGRPPRRQRGLCDHRQRPRRPAARHQRSASAP